MITKNASITNQVIDYLKENIESGAWQVGEKIPSENQMVSDLGVSRSSIRTAVQYLIGLGVLKSFQGKGTFLIDRQVENWDEAQNKITSADCIDIYKVLEFRRILEPEACRMAVERYTPEVFADLQHYLQQMERSRGNPAKFVRADLQFHGVICRASGNALLEKSLNKVFAETRNNHEQMNVLVGDYNGILYHTLILEAFRKGDAEDAYQKMLEHIEVTMREFQHDKTGE
mgnify:FL=1